LIAALLVAARSAAFAQSSEADEFEFAPPLSKSPFVPAEAGTQVPSIQALPSLGPRFRGDERNLKAIQAYLITL
jgi:hypothetical protein